MIFFRSDRLSGHFRHHRLLHDGSANGREAFHDDFVHLHFDQFGGSKLRTSLWSPIGLAGKKKCLQGNKLFVQWPK